MYDSVSLWHEQDRAASLPCLARLENMRSYVNEHGEETRSGVVRGLTVNVKERGVFVKGSLSTFAFGNNLERLTRRRTQDALEELSTVLSLPMNAARVYRFDIGSSFIVKHPPREYLEQLETKRRCKRSEYANLSTLHFSTNNYLCALYDKAKEMKKKREPLPSIFENRHVLRYEVQFKKRLGEHFGVKCLTAGKLHNEAFYSKVLKQWKDHYFSITRRQRLQVCSNVELHSTKDLQAYLCAMALQDRETEAALINRLRSDKEAGVTNERTFYRLKAALKDYRASTTLCEPNDRLEELDRLVRREVQYYR
jgi:hypothetical protein